MILRAALDSEGGGGDVRQRVVLEVLSPQTNNFAGLDGALKRLGAMEAQMRNIETRWQRMFSGGGAASVFSGAQASAQGVTAELHRAVQEANVLKAKFKNDNPIPFHRTVSGGPGVTGSQELDKLGKPSTSIWTIDYAKQAKAVKALADEHRYLGRNMVENLYKVTAWTSAVALLYGGVSLARNALQSLIETGFQTARLSQVFKGMGGSASQLTDDVLRLAAANGRSASEAMEAAIQWSRLGMSRVQVNEAVRVSLMAANVAEITAAQATEHLSALYSIYGLRAGQLNSVLGMLNATSNTYNVTNKDLLDGLSRTAAVARQAGIPLAELIGLLGAGVGATGQTGANMGNAIKSITGALSSADKLKILRDQFQFEGTDGGGGLKNMSELLGELFIKYNQMSEAERRSMLFGVAGKQQASRMAALLDNYVRSQVLAVNAQLNLNSAEEENAKIKATLKSQLQGLITEWVRFVNVQGNRGPVSGLTEVTKAMHNILRLANTSVGGAFVTGLEYLGIGIAAKLALTSFQMAKIGKDGSFVMNTFGGVKRMAGEVATSFNAIASQGASMWWLGGKGKGAFAVGAEALATMSTKAKLARVALIGLADVVAPFLILMAAVWAVNKAIEALGGSSEASKDRVAKLAESAERAGSAAEAFANRGRLIQNAQKVFEDPHTTEGARAALARQFSEALVPAASGDTAAIKAQKDTLRAARTQELHDIALVKDTEDRLGQSRAFWSREAAESFAMRAKKRQEERNDMKRIDHELRQQLAGLTDAKEVKAKKDEIEANANKRISSHLEDAQDNEDSGRLYRENDLAFRSYAASQKSMLEDLKALWDELPGDSHMDKLHKEMAVQELAIGRLKETLKIQTQIANEKSLPGGMGMQEAEKRYQIEADALDDAYLEIQLAKEKVALETELYRLAVARNEFGNADDTDVRAAEARYKMLAAKESELSVRELANEQLGASIIRQKADKDYLPSVERRNATQKLLDEMRVDYNKNLGRDPVAELRDRNARTMSFARAAASSFLTGDGEGEQFLNQQRRLRASSAINTGMANNPFLGAGEQLDAQVTAMQHKEELARGFQHAQERILELHKEETNLMIQKNREYARALLTAGPAELLRKLAIKQLGSVNSGQFFAFGQGARQDIMDLPGNSSEVQSNRRSQKYFKQYQDENPSGAEFYKQAAAAQFALYRSMQHNVGGGDGINPAAKEAATNISLLGNAAMAVRIELGALAERVKSMFIGTLTGRPAPTAQAH